MANPYMMNNPDEMRRSALLAQMRYAAPAPGAEQVPAAPIGAAPVAAPAPAAAPPAGPFKPTAGRYTVEGIDHSKWNSDHDSPKYQILKTLSNYDPTGGGISDAALADLNKLGLGTFEVFGTNRDKLRVGGNIDPRFNGVTEIDALRGAAAGGKAWQFGAMNDPRPEFRGRSNPAVSRAISPAALDIADSSDTMRMINAELDALMNAETAPTNREALIRLIRRA